LKILFVGDIIGRPGRNFLKERLQEFREKEEIDFCIANAENGSGGFGLIPDSAKELFTIGIDILTSGNHIWDRKEIMPFLDNEIRLLRPLNYPPGNPGKGEVISQTRQGVAVGIINLQGRAFMPTIDCPFRMVEPVLKKMRGETDIILVDFHAEATAEKIAMGWYLAGKVSAVIGTHTHVQTADERVLDGGTAYITDVGMTGSIAGVIGMKKKQALQKFVTQVSRRFIPDSGEVMMMGIILDIDEKTGKANSIRRVATI
jgi:metallophosphoesterase (TIGR00282 family)